MNPAFSDPNNHVPEVTPDDAWGDSEEVATTGLQGAALLPPRRVISDKPEPEEAREAGPRVEPKENPFKIEPRIPRATANDEPIRLDIQELIPAKVVRLEQEVPPPPKVERLTKFHERPARDHAEKQARSERHWGSSQRYPLRWVAGAAITLPLLIVGGFKLMPILNKSESPSGTGVVPEMESASHEAGDNDPLSRMLLMQSDAIRLYQGYARARHLDDVLPLLRDGSDLSEILRSRWQALEVPADWQVPADSTWSVETLAGRPCGKLDGEMADHTRFVAYFTLDGDRLLLDWKATTGFGTATFPELIQGRGDAREIRGIIAPDLYYNPLLPEADYQSFCFSSPGGDEVLWCYVSRQSPTFAIIARALTGGMIVRDGRAATKMTLHLVRGPEGSQPNQWLIQDVLHLDWVNP